MDHAPAHSGAHQVTLAQGVVSFASGLDKSHATLLRSIASFAVATPDPYVLRVNMQFLSEHLGYGTGEIITLLGHLQEAQVSVRTSQGEEFHGLVRGAVPADHGTAWDIHLGTAGAWLVHNNRGGNWW